MTNENISIVIIDHNDPAKLEDAIRTFLSAGEAYADTDTTIVVDKGKKESEELIEKLKPQFPAIHITFVPDTSRRMSDQKIAILLGVKAASNDTVRLIDTYHRDISPYHQFACKQRHRRLRRRHGGIDFDIDDNCLSFSKQKFINRDAIEDNISFVNSCYEPPKGHYVRRLWTGIKYVLHKCHLYPSS